MESKLSGSEVKYYTGVGSRETPWDIQITMTAIARYLEKQGYYLRSGGAPGADTAFESGTDHKEIYLPWKGFNGNESYFYRVGIPAYQLAATIHPAWDKLKPGAKKLHARNCYQVLGEDLNTPSDFVICWTEGGKPVGGTRTAIVLAQKWNIDVFNLAKPHHLKYWEDKIKE